MGLFKKKIPTSDVAVTEEKPTSVQTKKTSVVSASVILHPVVTEKSAILASKNMYVFAVKKYANRISIAGAVQAMYDVKPVSVNVQNVRGKVVRRGRISGVRKGWKKAIVTLPKGKTLNLYEGV
jgi:large subunit ribosomal protein L23